MSRPGVGVQYHTDRTSSVHVEHFNRFVGATAHDDILKNVKDKVIDKCLLNQAELAEEVVVSYSMTNMERYM